MMTYRGERAFIERELDYLWSVMQDVLAAKETARPEAMAELDNLYAEARQRFDWYRQRLDELLSPWWYS
jgi:hypothetical protein